jgi:hypothetical protein
MSILPGTKLRGNTIMKSELVGTITKELIKASRFRDIKACEALGFNFMMLNDCLGELIPVDEGKRVYRFCTSLHTDARGNEFREYIYQAENNQQRDARLAKADAM